MRVRNVWRAQMPKHQRERDLRDVFTETQLAARRQRREWISHEHRIRERRRTFWLFYWAFWACLLTCTLWYALARIAQ